ncbi:hypothetical protein [Lysobacter capsici]|nr:hypothetical protein [Lysobacter capsici]
MLMNLAPTGPIGPVPGDPPSHAPARPLNGHGPVPPKPVFGAKLWPRRVGGCPAIAVPALTHYDEVPAMKSLKRSAQCLMLGLSLSLALSAQAQTVGYNIRTGDVWVDTRLGEINDYGRRYPEPFVDEISGYYGAPRSYVEELLQRRRWAPGDVYYACALARSLGVPCQNVVREYDRNPGQGWGAVAKRMGIKPGSPAFHALKRGAVTTYDRWGYPIRVDQSVHVNWADHGPGKGHGKSKGPDHRSYDSGYPSSQGHGKGKSHKGGESHGNGHGKDKGHGKGHGNGNGNGKVNGKGHGH